MTPASIRNNNPGAMEPGPSSRKFGSTSHEVLKWRGPDGKPRENRIATFPTGQHGAAAMFDLLERKYTGQPLAKAIATWCGGYWAGEYAKTVEDACGLTGSDTLTKEAVRTAATAIPICKAMARVEAGKDFPLDDDGWQAAHAMAFSGELAPAPSPENDVPFPKPEAIAREKSAEVKRKGLWATLWASIAGTATTVATNGIPAPPAAVTDSVANLGSWKGLGTTILADPILLGGVAILGAIWGIPALLKLRGGE